MAVSAAVANSEVWAFRRCWPREKEQIKAELLSGSYRFSLLTRMTLKDGDDTDLWSARDALVLKTLALVLAKQLPVSRRAAANSLPQATAQIAGVELERSGYRDAGWSTRVGDIDYDRCGSNTGKDRRR